MPTREVGFGIKMHEDDFLAEKDFFVGLLLDESIILVALCLEPLFVVLGVLLHVLIVDLKAAFGEQLEEPVAVIIDLGDVRVGLVEDVGAREPVRGREGELRKRLMYPLDMMSPLKKFCCSLKSP